VQRGRKPKRGRVEAPDDGKHSSNRRGAPLCGGFQSGNCTQVNTDGFCVKDTAKRHQCARCLSQSHGADMCTLPRAHHGKGDKGKGDRGKGKYGGGGGKPQC
jgi:hypothetical protein